MKLLQKWDTEGVAYDERRVELSQDVLDEARKYGSLVPIIVWPDGRVEQGFGDTLGCFIPEVRFIQCAVGVRARLWT